MGVEQDATPQRAHLWIHGEVQGVGFRYTARAVAREVGVLGWVRNLPDPTVVEAVVEGDAMAVGAFIHWCHRGPSGGLVTHVECTRETPRGEFATFAIRH